MLFCYPSIARKSLAVFDCVLAGEDAVGTPVELLRHDPAIVCYDAEWRGWAVIAATIGIGFYCLGFPLFAFFKGTRALQCELWREAGFRSCRYHSEARSRVSIVQLGNTTRATRRIPMNTSECLFS